MKRFEEKVIDFINKLKSHPINDNIFNTWANYNEYDKDYHSSEKRCSNLKNYLINHKDAKYILIGESPSYGCRFSGIAMTSEDLFPEYLKDLSPSSKEGNTSEGTAKVLWDVIGKQHNSFVLWNAFAYHHNKDGKYQKPSQQEITDNIVILKLFLDLFPKAKIICVGATSEKAFKIKRNNLGNYIDRIVGCVRHPSYGGATKFRDAISKLK